MPKKVKKEEQVVQWSGVTGNSKDTLDGGTVATPITKEQRAQLNSVCSRLDRLPAWVLREALKMYLNSIGGAA